MRVLIAEDNTSLAENIKYCLVQTKFDSARTEVDIVENGAKALISIQKNYDLLILDLKMPKADGTQIIEVLNEMSPRQRPIVILTTAYSDVFHETAHIGIKMGVQALLEKPFELTDLLETIRELVQAHHQLLAYEEHDTRLQCNWTLTFSEAGIAFIQTSGRSNFAESCPLPWTHWDELEAAQKAQATERLFTTSSNLHDDAKFQAKEVGTGLYEKLFVGNIQNSFIAAGSAVLHNHHLKLTFIGPRHFLSLPLEFLNNKSDYLVLRHPMKRVVTGIRTRGNTGLSDLLRELQDSGQKLGILLIASNTYPMIESVDAEVAALYNYLKTYLKGVLPPNRYIIDYLPTEQATYDEVLARLTGCKYHMLHYAGHGYHDEKFPERSSLFFWEKENCQGDAKALPVSTLKNILRIQGHDLRFVYLSCCSGTATSSKGALLNDNFLGIADGLILAGVSAVLGFRWPVSDKGAQELAMSFYESLFAPGQGALDVALFNARCKAEGSEECQDLADWLSPILIAQG